MLEGKNTSWESEEGTYKITHHTNKPWTMPKYGQCMYSEKEETEW